MSSVRTLLRRAALAGLGLGLLLAGGRGAAEPPAGAPAVPRAPSPRIAALGLDADWPWPERATLHFMEQLGWRAVLDPALTQPVVQAGTPGQRLDLEAAQAAGDLTIRLPAGAQAGPALRSLLPALADGVASRLAYQLHLSKAVQRATQRLEALTKAGRYKFPSLLLWNSPFFQFHPPRPEWTERGELFVAGGRPSAAVEAIYARGASAECYTGQWVALYAMQYELLGAEGFDEAFRPSEVVIGRPSDVRRTPIGQTLLGDRTYPYRALFIPPDKTRYDPGSSLAWLGPQAFTGLTGIVRCQDETDSGNQNLVIVSVSARANELLRTQGGFAYIAKLGREAAQAWNARGGLFGSAGGRAKALADFERILADPVLAEVRVYVHPFGTVPLAEMFRYEIDDTDRAVYVLPYVHGREDDFFRRYRATLERRWLRSQGVAVAPGGAPGLPPPAPPLHPAVPPVPPVPPVPR